MVNTTDTRVRVQARIPEELHLKMKYLAVDKRTSLAVLTEQAIKEFMEKQNDTTNQQ